VPNYGPVARGSGLESYIRQLALEPAPGRDHSERNPGAVTDTPPLRLIPGHKKLIEIAKKRNLPKRLTTPDDVARCIMALCHPATYWMTRNTARVDSGESIVG
jgi:enoyl-[acyl-carrier protein] reductase III